MSADTAQRAVNVAALRAQMTLMGRDGFIVPHAVERLAWVSGYTGSAGAALIFQDKAILFADGRYTLQLREQTGPAVFAGEDSGAKTTLTRDKVGSISQRTQNAQAARDKD